MAKTYEELLEQAAIIRDETAAGKNTATRVGGTITDAVDYVKELQDTYKGIHAEAAAAKQAAAAANTKNAEQDGKISSLEAKDATHDTQIAKIEERVLQYLYPKIYQINEGAGARVFHGFYKGSASVSDERKTASEDGFSYKVVFKSGSFYLQEISPEGVTVLYSSWAEISLPNNEIIASSESYAQRDCLYYIYVESEGCTYYYIDSNGAASEQSATYLLRLLANKNASAIAALQGNDAAQDEKIAGLQSVQNHSARNLSLSGRVLQMKDMYGSAVGDSVTFPDNGNIYEGTAGASSVPFVFAKTFGGTVTATLGAATSARAGVMTIDHLKRISKLEERVMQYLYPKIYQLNEGAGARVFDGFTEENGEGGLILTKDTYRYSVLYSTTQKQFVLNVTDEASGVTVLYSSWPKISLPNNKSIASSESYALRDCLYYIYVEGEGSTYYYIDSNGAASEKSATYLLRLLANKNAAAIAALQGKDAEQDVEIATLHERDTDIDNKISALEAKDIEHNDAIVAIQGKDAAQDGEIATLHERDTAIDNKISALEAKDIEHNAAIVRKATVEYYDTSVTDGPSRINTRAIFKFFGADNNKLFTAPLLGAGDGYPGLLSLKNKIKLDGYADTFPQNPVASSESNGLMSVEDKTKLDSVGGVIDLPWDDDVQGQDGYINNFTERGEYHIHGKRLYDNDGLPIINSGDEHTIDGLMTVLDSSLTNGKKYDVCVTQFLRLNNRKGGDGHIFVRTGIAATKSELQRSTASGWSPWEKLMGVFEKNAVSNATDLNEYTSSGMYDGMFVYSPDSQTTVSGLKIENGSTFLMVAVNGYAVAQTGVVPQVTQLLYVMPSGLDGSSGVRNSKLYTRTGIYVASTKTYTWGKFDGLAYASDISKLNGYIQENSGLIQENQVAITANAKEIANVNSTATRAQETADRAQKAANTAQTTADSASSAAAAAQTAADTAQETANAAQETATAASTAAQEAKTAADNAQNAAENEATARIEADTELQSKINGKQDNIGSLSADEKAAFLVSLGLGKIGIVSQKQTWNAVGVEPAYVMSEKVEGFISKDNIDSLISYGFAFNEGTGYFELNGLTDISLQEALNIVAAGKPNFSLCDLHYAHKNIRTNLPIFDNNQYNSGYFGTGISNRIKFGAMAMYSDIEVFVYGQYKKNDTYTQTGFQYSVIEQSGSLFRECLKLEKAFIIPGTTTRFYDSFKNCKRLKELELVFLQCDVDLSGSAYLSAKSTHIMIANANNNKAITITLHADAKARWEASEYYEEDSGIIKDKHITIA